MKRIIWVAQNSHHAVLSIWYPHHRQPLKEWKALYKRYAKYITKHYIEV